MLKGAGKKTASARKVTRPIRLAFVLVSSLLLIVGLLSKSDIKCAETTVSVKGRQLCVKVSDDNDERLSGLSGTKYLGPDEGMLFAYDLPGYYGIWMKNMNYNIDILWLDSEKSVVHIEDNVPPESYPKVFTPKYLSDYVIELSAGASSRLNINKGDKLYW
jgi:uncharacterized membrane protein (UPF0127 family)